MRREIGHADLRRLIELTFEIDVLVSMAGVTAEKAYAYPTLEDEYPGIELEGLTIPSWSSPSPMTCSFPPRLASYS